MLHSISQIPAELQLKLCEFLPIEDILNVCESIPSWRWIRQSRWFQCLAFRRSTHWSWIDRHICSQLEPQSAPIFFSDPVGTLQYQWWDQILHSQIWSSNTPSNSSDDIVGSSGRFSFNCILFHSLCLYLISGSGSLEQEPSNRAAFDLNTTYNSTLGEFSVTTHFHSAFTEPLYETFWKEFCRRQLNEANESELTDAVYSCLTRYVQAMGHIIACADAVIYIAHSMYLLRSDIDYFLEHLRADQILLIVMLTDDNADGSTTLFSLISLLQYLGGLENSKLTKVRAYWRVWCLQMDANGQCRWQDIFTWVHCALISQKILLSGGRD